MLNLTAGIQRYQLSDKLELAYSNLYKRNSVYRENKGYMGLSIAACELESLYNCLRGVYPKEMKILKALIVIDIQVCIAQPHINTMSAI